MVYLFENLSAQGEFVQRTLQKDEPDRVAQKPLFFFSNNQ